MIGMPTGTRIWIVAGVTDLRRGFTGLSGMVQTALAENPFPATCSCFAASAAICSKFFGGVAMGCACSRKDWNEEDSFGRKRRTERCH